MSELLLAALTFGLCLALLQGVLNAQGVLRLVLSAVLAAFGIGLIALTATLVLNQSPSPRSADTKFEVYALDPSAGPEARFRLAARILAHKPDTMMVLHSQAEISSSAASSSSTSKKSR